MKTMRYGYISEARREGRAEGLAKAVLAFLDDRGIDVNHTDRERITSCDDEEVLMRWLLRAPSASSVADLLED